MEKVQEDFEENPLNFLIFHDLYKDYLEHPNRDSYGDFGEWLESQISIAKDTEYDRMQEMADEMAEDTERVDE